MDKFPVADAPKFPGLVGLPARCVRAVRCTISSSPLVSARAESFVFFGSVIVAKDRTADGRARMRGRSNH
jgi:hypothetical protein